MAEGFRRGGRCRGRIVAWAAGGLTLAGALAPAPAHAADPAPAADSARASTATPRAETAPPSGSRSPAAAPASATPVDPELLEFLGSDDVEAELRDYVATREPAKPVAQGGSSGR